MCDLWDLVSTFQGDGVVLSQRASALSGWLCFFLEGRGFGLGLWEGPEGLLWPLTPNRLWEDRAGRAGQVAQWLDTFQGQALLFPLEARLVSPPLPQHWHGELGFGEEAVPRGGGRCSPSAHVVGLPGL